ncbi:uncharacterized protein BDZ99DRAFT_545725 [Mytilinidion resinicola]|uniref:Uncharacterized protein n=1 Tax=Mytilinidion resinicola TaxID=574789 RepID=A0A6A6Y572_9PEZI|nr:uncharacterized protein BDZ99DRAFT_545725 [Mytilinidion resinicola]KAF2803942.1 hypothetical protein BDZ99DRAFT_545725 [Mytilinidion resinicola]
MAEDKAPPLRPPFTLPQSTAPGLQAALQSLPATYELRTQHVVHLVNDDVEGFLEQDLDLERLNVIHHLLWMAGRPLNARPLHRQQMMGFDVLQTEQADLHLLKFSNRLFIKPLPAFLLNCEFWEKYLCGPKSKALHESACGFLLSYLWLVRSPLDLKVAQELDLLPLPITWVSWKRFVTDFCSHVDVNSLHQVNKRYLFGELRLGRINTIYRIRFFRTHFVRGYLYGYNRYVVFFQRNFGWVLIVFVFFSLVFSAMQVGAGTPQLADSATFQNAAYGFTVFSIVAVAALLGFVAVTFSSMFIYNMISAISHDKTENAKRNSRAQRSHDRGEAA